MGRYSPCVSCCGILIGLFGITEMNERIKELAKEAAREMNETGTYSEPKFQEKFAELIVQECGNVLFDESERFSALYSEEDDWQSAEEYEIRSNQCIDNIAVIEKHFGVEE
jgi:hypothetical protein